MKRMLAVAARELEDRRAILIAALVAGLLPFASPLFPGVRADRWGEARDLMALVLAAAFGCGTALVAGATAVARDLADRRLGFDFARPIGGGAIWAGRFLGALALTILVLGLVLAPAALASGDLFAEWSRDGAEIALAALGTLLVLVPLAHVVSVAFRSRSGWLGVDLVVCVVVVLAFAWGSRQLLVAFASEALLRGLLVVGIATIPAFWGASAAQLLVGRTDLRRGHRAQSLALGSSLLALAVAFSGYAQWVLSPGPADLKENWGAAAPRGDWIVAHGTARGRGNFEPAFLLDAATGAYTRLGSSWISSASFAADGKRAVVVRPVGSRAGESYSVSVADLGTGAAVLAETTISLTPPIAGIALSADGARLAAADLSLLTVFEIASGATLASARIPAGARYHRTLYFQDANVVRLLIRPEAPGPIAIHELDIPSRRFEKTGEIPAVGEWTSIRRFPGADRLFVSDARKAERAIAVDGRTGAVLATYAASPGAKAVFRPLSDGRVAALEQGAGMRRLRVLSADGGEERAIELDPRERGVVGGEPAGGLLVLAVTEQDESAVGWKPSEYRVLLLDLDAGTVREAARGLLPLAGGIWGDELDLPGPGATAARLYRTADSLVLHDPVAGTTRAIAGKGAPGS